MFNKAKKIEQWKSAGLLSGYLLYSHEFASHRRHSYKVFPHLNFWGCIFHVRFIIFCVLIVCLFFFFFFFFFVSFYFCVFCIVFLGCVVFVCLFVFR